MMKEVAILKNAREGRVKGRGSDDFRKNAFEGLNATIGAVVRIPRLSGELIYAGDNTAHSSPRSKSN